MSRPTKYDDQWYEENKEVLLSDNKLEVISNRLSITLGQARNLRFVAKNKWPELYNSTVGTKKKKVQTKERKQTDELIKSNSDFILDNTAAKIVEKFNVTSKQAYDMKARAKKLLGILSDKIDQSAMFNQYKEYQNKVKNYTIIKRVNGKKND